MYGRNVNIRFGGPLTPMVKYLMIINGAVFIIGLLIDLIKPGLFVSFFGLSHIGIFYEFKIWQVFTYMFLHGGWLHIFFNLFALWMFAGELEQLWGSRFFLRYYLYSGIGAGFFIMFMNFFLYTRYGISVPTVGASGAVYAILLAYGMTWPNREVMLYFLFPIKIKYLVIAFGLIEFFGTLSTAAGRGGSVSHIGHIGGLIAGFLILNFRSRFRTSNSKSSQQVSDKLSQLFKQKRVNKKKKQIEERIRAKKIIDRLLEKIAKNGMSSLSAKERKDLEWARRHYYPEENDTMH